MTPSRRPNRTLPMMTPASTPGGVASSDASVSGAAAPSLRVTSLFVRDPKILAVGVGVAISDATMLVSPVDSSAACESDESD
jgi:hypothetical protein